MTLATAPKVLDGFQPRNAPELIQFKKPGESVGGTLVSYTSVEIDRKKVWQFLIRGASGRVAKIHATYDLTQKLSRSDLGNEVYITFLGEDPSVARNGNAMKVFDVQVRPPAKPAGENAGGSPITDEDIPF